MIGIVALAAAVFVAAFAITTYEAWSTIALVVFGVIVLAIDRSSLPRKAAVLTAIGLIGSIVLASAGGWMVLLGIYSGAAPCEDVCFDNRVLLLPGFVILIVAIVLAVISARSLVGAFGSTPSATSTHDGSKR